jgi:hypothetical protein
MAKVMTPMLRQLRQTRCETEMKAWFLFSLFLPGLFSLMIYYSSLNVPGAKLTIRRFSPYQVNVVGMFLRGQSNEQEAIDKLLIERAEPVLKDDQIPNDILVQEKKNRLKADILLNRKINGQKSYSSLNF